MRNSTWNWRVTSSGAAAAKTGQTRRLAPRSCRTRSITVGAPAALPRSLPEALDRLAANETAAGWFGATHFDAYLRFKRVEAEKAAELSPAELCARYAEVY